MKTKRKPKVNRTQFIFVGNSQLLVNWKELQKQRRGLTDEGLLSFFDAFCDAAAEVLGEEVVFGRKLT